ncbi:MAG: hypothetical protein EXS15_03765 [Phycisphaerales bacterium]|nr:hypothetical protein [Phycisphaerales bacterium]
MMPALCITAASLVGCDRGASEKAINPHDPAAMRATISAIESALHSDRLSDALAIATRLTEVAPNSCDAFELLARVEIAISLDGRTATIQTAARQSAAHAYGRAVELCPPNAGLLNAAGVAAQTIGEMEAAIDYFARAGALDPTNCQHPLFQGLALAQLDRFNEATAVLTTAQSIDPTSPWPIAALSAIALHTDDPERALTLAREARVLDPRMNELRVPEAKALRRLGRHQEILTLLLALEPSARLSEAITWEIAAAHDALGNRGEGALAWGKWAEQCGSAQSAVDAARRWDEAGDPIQAHTWRRVARQRGWRE